MSLSLMLGGVPSAVSVAKNALSGQPSSLNFVPFNSAINRINSIAGANTATSALEAEKLRNWQEMQNQKVMNFNAIEAAKNRDWQKMMSDTAHQREVADLQAAGLNPVLSAMNGNGASVTSGATASGVSSSGAMGEPDRSGAVAFVSLLGSILNAQMQLNATQTSAITNLAVADKYTQMSEITSRIMALANTQAAGIHAGAAMYGSDKAYASSIYGYDTQKYMQASSQWHDKDMASNYPSNMWNVLAGIVGGSDGLSGLPSLKDVGNKVSEWLNSTGSGKKLYEKYKSLGYYD